MALPRYPSILALLRLPTLEQLRPVVDLHSKGKAHAREDLLDLLERLAAKVLRLEHVLLGPLHQLADQRDVRVLKAVRAPNAQLQLVHAPEQVLVHWLLVARRL